MKRVLLVCVCVTSGLAFAGSDKIDADTTKFLLDSASSLKASTEYDQLAVKMSDNKQLTAFAEKLLKQNNESYSDLGGLASKLNVSLPTKLDADDVKSLEKLSHLSGKDFEKQFLAIVVDGNEEDLVACQDQVKNGQHPDVQAFAKKWINAIQTQLGEAKSLEKSLNVAPQ